MAYREFFPWLVGRAGGLFAGGSYTPEFVLFHGDGTRLEHAAATGERVYMRTTESDQTMTISFWMRPSSVAAGPKTILMCASDPTGVNKDIYVTLSGSSLSVFLGSAAGARASVAGIAAGTLYHVLVSLDCTSSPQAICYVNDAPAGTLSAFAETLSTRSLTTIGAEESGSDAFAGELSDLWVEFGKGYVDLSVEANRRKFIDASGNPVDLGADGTKPTGNIPDIYISGNPTEWNFGTASKGKALNGAFAMIGYGVDYPYDVGKIAFRKMEEIGTADPADWVSGIPAAPGGPPKGDGSIAAGMPTITGDALGLANVTAGEWEGWYQTGLTVAATATDLPLNFVFHANFIGQTQDIRISISHNGTAYSQYLFTGTEAMNCGDFVLTCLPSMATAAVAPNGGYLPKDCSVVLTAGDGTNTPSGTGWVPASGISDIQIEVLNFHSYWSSAGTAATRHLAYLGCYRGIPFTPTIINIMDDGNDAILDVDDGLGGDTAAVRLGVLNATRPLPLHIAFIGSQMGTGNLLTEAELNTLVGTGYVHLMTHGDENIGNLITLDVDYSGAGSAFLVGDPISDGTDNGDVKAILADVGEVQTLLIERDGTGDDFDNGFTAVTGGSGAGTYTASAEIATGQEIGDRVLGDKNVITAAGFNSAIASHYVYPEGGYRTDFPEFANVVAGMVVAGMKTARTTQAWTCGGLGSASTASVGIESFALANYSLEDRTYHVAAAADYENKFINGYFLKAGGLHTTRFHVPVTSGASATTQINIADLFVFWDAQATIIDSGLAKCLTMDELYTQLAAHMSWTSTGGEDYDP